MITRDKQRQEAYSSQRDLATAAWVSFGQHITGRRHFAWNRRGLSSTTVTMLAA